MQFDNEPNGDTIYVLQNEDESIPGEGVGPAALLNFLHKDLWAKQAHIEIRKEVSFII